MQQLEDAIISRLTAVPTLPESVRLFSWPDKPMDRGQPVGVAAIFARFAGVSKSSAATTNRTFTQGGTIDFEIRFLVKDLRSHVGAYPLMALVENSLAGWLPDPSLLEEGYTAKLPGFYMSRSDLVGRDQQVWDWGQSYSLPIIYTRRNHNA